MQRGASAAKAAEPDSLNVVAKATTHKEFRAQHQHRPSERLGEKSAERKKALLKALGSPPWRAGLACVTPPAFGRGEQRVSIVLWVGSGGARKIGHRA